MDLLGDLGADPISYWQAVLTAAGLGVWDYDIASGEKRYSRLWHSIRGLKPGDPMPQTDEEWYETVHPEDRALARHYTALINEGRADEVAFEYRELRTDGTWVWIMCRGRAIAHDATGRATRFVGVDTDITAMKRTEDERALYARQLDMALDIGQIGVWRFDTVTETVTWDRRMRQIYGVNEDLSPLPRAIWERFLHPDDRERVLEHTAWGISQGADYDLDYRILREDGSERYIRSKVSRIEEGGGASFMGINWDVTKDVQGALQLEQAKQEAEERLYQLELAHKELEYLSNHDPLSGLHNRRSLRAHLARIAPEGVLPAGMAILIFDVDRFKRVNDRFGHAYGDDMIQIFARALTETLEDARIIARTGGDEFLALVSDAEAPEVRAQAEAVIARVRADTRARGEEQALSVGIAFGDGQRNISEVMTAADHAMYKAKLMGGAIAATA
jgi:diguanylate cyclase (GGDEF)-like protein/PAS domain S-box-containing protein